MWPSNFIFLQLCNVLLTGQLRTGFRGVVILLLFIPVHKLSSSCGFLQPFQEYRLLAHSSYFVQFLNLLYPEHLNKKLEKYIDFKSEILNQESSK